MAEVNVIGLVGAGQMGAGIAQVCAMAGYRVVMYDIDVKRVEAAIGTIRHSLNRQVVKGVITQETVEQALGRIVVAENGIADLDVSDLVIEAATEKEDIKKKILADLCKVVPASTFIATNTSSISITGLAASTDRPEKFIGLHFMNPVPVMKLIEIIRGFDTSQETYDMAAALATRLGKTVANAGDFPAFIVNRVLMPMINEAVYTLYEGVGTVQSIDTAMKLGANHPMGPLELADFIGLDTCLSIMQVLYDGLSDSKYRPCPLLIKYVEAGWLGKKTGRGFYDYRGETPIPTR